MRSRSKIESTGSFALFRENSSIKPHITLFEGPNHGPAPRSLPLSEDGEKGVLCSLLLAPQEVADDCVLKLQSDAFYIPAHRIVYDTVLELRDKNRPIDFVSLRQTLKDRNQLEEVGGIHYLNHLYTFVPTPANAEYYITIVHEKYQLRRLILACGKISTSCYEPQEEVGLVIDDAEREIFGISQGMVSNEIPSFKERILKAWETLEHAIDHKGEPIGLPTGFKDLDRILGGLQPADMIVIAARPSMGKTALAMNIVEHVALEMRKPTAVFSLEMSAEQLTQRILSSRAKVESSRLRNGFLTERDIQELTRVSSLISDAPLLIDDTPGLTIMELRAIARRLKTKHEIELVVIDYLQLLRSPTKKASDNRQIEITEISGGIKGLAKELKIPIIVVAQLNRQPEQREGGKPRLSDLRESGSIEQDADVVGLLVRPEYYAKDDDEKDEHEGKAELLIAKQRNGPTGEIPLTFVKRFARFESAIEESQGPHCGTPIRS